MSMLFKRIKDWATSITAFRTGDVIPVDGPSGTAKMSKDALLALVAQPNGTYPDMTAGIANNLPFGFVILANTPSSGNAPANAGILCELVPNLTTSSGYFVDLDVFITQINRVYAKCKVRMFVRSDGDGTTVNYRSWVIWEKPNPTSITVTVRRSTTTKKLFLCAKGASGIYAGCYAVLRSASNMFGRVSKSLPDWIKMYPDAELQNIDYLIDDTTESNRVGSSSQPVFMDTDGSVKACNIRFIPVSGSWTAPNVSGDAKFTLYNDSGSSVSLTAGSLSKTLLADEYCDLFAVNGTWKKFSYSYI